MENFNPNHVLENSDIIIDHHWIDIQNFFKAHKSPLANMKIGGRFISTIINDTCAIHKVNPKWILLRLQVEQSLISGNIHPTQHALDWSLGFGASDDGRNPLYKGMDTQIKGCVIWTAERYKNSINKPLPVEFRTSEGITVHPQNIATYICYTYTPWCGSYDSHGNKSPFGNYLLHICNRKYFFNE